MNSAKCLVCKCILKDDFRSGDICTSCCDNFIYHFRIEKDKESAERGIQPRAEPNREYV